MNEEKFDAKTEAREVVTDARWETSQRWSVSERRDDAATRDIALMRVSFRVVGSGWTREQRSLVETEIRRIFD